MSREHFTASDLLAIPLELRNLIYLELARTYVLTVSARDRTIHLADDGLANTCCAMHRRGAAAFSTATSLALVSRQIAAEARRVAFHRTRSPLTVYFASVDALGDFERHGALYRPAALRDFCLAAARTVRVKAPPAWQALPLPGPCFKALQEFEVTECAANLHDQAVLSISLKWEGWEKEESRSDDRKWVYLRNRMIET